MCSAKLSEAIGVRQGPAPPRESSAEPRPILIVDPQSDWYEGRLAAAVPEAPLRTARSFADATPHLAEAGALITMGHPLLGLELTRETVDGMPQLQWVQCLLAGHEHLSGALEARPEIMVTTARGIHGPQMAETALLHMLVLARRVKQQIVNQGAQRWEPWPQPLLDGRVAGIVGLGASGKHLARICKSLGMTVFGVTRTSQEVDSVDRRFARSQVKEAAAQVDFLVLTARADETTDKLIDASVLDAMKPTSYLINIARGTLVDEEALLDALRARRIAGAGLDVFSHEPLPADSPLWRLDNVFVTPHVAGLSDRYREQTLAILEPNLRAFTRGRLQDLRNLVPR